MLSFGHLVFVRHVTCPEHGDLMDSGHAHEALSAPAGVAEASVSLPAVASALLQAESGHDHCLVCTTTRERFVLLPLKGTRAESVALPVAFIATVAASPFSPVAVIVLSPKNSPPAA
jgi:hypothetical protein